MHQNQANENFPPRRNRRTNVTELLMTVVVGGLCIVVTAAFGVYSSRSLVTLLDWVDVDRVRSSAVREIPRDGQLSVPAKRSAADSAVEDDAEASTTGGKR